ncbi:Sodium-dependent transporter [Candidatus Rhodobacter oscarellae]|uniref:Sodium-dependent transporter n=1 Tax=Candidatus Rhodobacter oscarellae TaxID=1675527 RepID=A0A0J9E5Z3_9RHOB|nr:bile acid:sodium symporter family protein [Candidatus Rhodobacter lobularis]KMW57229.1 Sodium-dependent transporter [Candidatus Rhodobacter lobularis]
MDILLNLGLPLVLAFIMFSLGLGLTVADFAQVARAPKAFAIGALAQLVLLPLVAFLVLLAFPVESALAVGVMILAFCPGGVTSNMLTRLAGGSVALSISLTAVISLVSALTVPLLVAWAAGYFEGAAAPEINVASLAVAMFLITILPVALGLLLRHFRPAATADIEPFVFRAAAALFVLIVLAAVVANWTLFIENLASLGPLLVALNLLLLGIGMALARVAGLQRKEGIAISIEAGVQNATLGITVGSLIAGEALSSYALPSGVYGITMYLVTLPVIFLMLRRV